MHITFLVVLQRLPERNGTNTNKLTQNSLLLAAIASVGGRVVHQVMLVVAEVIEVHGVGRRGGRGDGGRLVPFVARVVVLVDEMVGVRVVRVRVEVRGDGRRRRGRQVRRVAVRRRRRHAGECSGASAQMGAEAGRVRDRRGRRGARVRRRRVVFGLYRLRCVRLHRVAVGADAEAIRRGPRLRAAGDVARRARVVLAVAVVRVRRRFLPQTAVDL